MSNHQHKTELGVRPTRAGSRFVVLQGFYEWVAVKDLLAEDQRFASLFYTPAVKMQLFEILKEEFPKQTTAEWSARLTQAGARFAPVQDYAEAVIDPMVLANGYIQKATHPDLGDIDVVGSPIRLSDTPMTISARAPELGEHTEEILLELGYTWEDIASLRESDSI